MSKCDRRAVLPLMETYNGTTGKSHACPSDFKIDLARGLIIICDALFIDFIIVAIRIDTVWI